MTLAIVTGIYPPIIGGAGAVMYALAAHAPDRIAVLTGAYDDCGNPVGADISPPEGGRVYRVRNLSRILTFLPNGKLRAITQAVYDRLLLHPRATRELLRIFDSLKPEVICIGTLTSCYWVVGAVKKWRPGSKIIIYVHGEELPELMKGGYHSRLRLQALRSASRFVAISSFTKNGLVSLGIPEDRVSVITNGVDLTRFRPGEKNQHMIDRHGLANRRVLMTLARLDERKGQDMLIRALPRIRAAVPDVVYLLVGDGGYEATLRRLVSELSLEDAVVFAGAATDSEVLQFYLTCDVFAMPNRTTPNGDTEGFGLVFLEAGACAKPVIGGVAGGVPDAVIHGKTGFLVDGTSPEAIADSCIRLLQDAELRHEFGANGLANARNNQWHMKTQQFLALCDTLMLD